MPTKYNLIALAVISSMFGLQMVQAYDGFEDKIGKPCETDNQYAKEGDETCNGSAWGELVCKQVDGQLVWQPKAVDSEGKPVLCGEEYRCVPTTDGKVMCQIGRRPHRSDDDWTCDK